MSGGGTLQRIGRARKRASNVFGYGPESASVFGCDLGLSFPTLVLTHASAGGEVIHTEIPYTGPGWDLEVSFHKLGKRVNKDEVSCLCRTASVSAVGDP